MNAMNAMNAPVGGTVNDSLRWMLEDALTVPGARHAILLSSDGMLRAHSQGISRDEAERQAAALSALQSISRSTQEFAHHADTAWRQTLMAVSAAADVDMEAVTFRMHKLVDRLGKELTSPPRQDRGRSA
jgi:hypothetical protein